MCPFEATLPTRKCWPRELADEALRWWVELIVFALLRLLRRSSRLSLTFRSDLRNERERSALESCCITAGVGPEVVKLTTGASPAKEATDSLASWHAQLTTSADSVHDVVGSRTSSLLVPLVQGGSSTEGEKDRMRSLEWFA